MSRSAISSRCFAESASVGARCSPGAASVAFLISPSPSEAALASLTVRRVKMIVTKAAITASTAATAFTVGNALARITSMTDAGRQLSRAAPVTGCPWVRSTQSPRSTRVSRRSVSPRTLGATGCADGGCGCYHAQRQRRVHRLPNPQPFRHARNTCRRPCPAGRPHAATVERADSLRRAANGRITRARRLRHRPRVPAHGEFLARGTASHRGEHALPLGAEWVHGLG